MKKVSCAILISLLPAMACEQKPLPPPRAAERSGESPERRELVLQPRNLEHWKPQDAARKVTLLLICAESRIKAGKPFRYRMEIRNVGRESIMIREPYPSFIKEGSLCGEGGFGFETFRRGARPRKLPCHRAAGVPSNSGFDVELKSGEFLLTKPSGPSDRFRDLLTDYRFEKGAYRIRAFYKPFNAVSNTIAIDVD